MTKEREAQQAQTIADIKRNHRTEKGLNKLAMAHHDRGQLLKIVDSQAQKIADLKADKNGFEVAFDIEQADAEKLRQKIAEQAKEIERLKEQVKVTARQVHDAAQLRL